MEGIDLSKYNFNVDKDTLVQKKESFSLNKLLNTDLAVFGKTFSDKQKEGFYIELHTLITAGVDIKAALELVEEEQNKQRSKDLIRTITEKVIGGSALSEAFRETKEFSPYEYYSIQIGEETGKLPIVLKQLAAYYTNKLKQRRQFVSALSYPIVILLTSIGAVGFMLYFIVPMFSDIFKRFGGELPYLTQLIISASTWLGNNIIYIVLALLGLFAFVWFNRTKEWFRKYGALTLAKIPVFGSLVTAIYLARFCSSMGLLIGSKVPLLRAIELSKQMVDYYPIEASLSGIKENILQGKPLYSSLSEYVVYERRMVALIKVGEEVNKLDDFFDKLATSYTNEVEHRTGLLNTFLEPAMIIFLGIMVGFILIAMYLPMFQLSTSIGG